MAKRPPAGGSGRYGLLSGGPFANLPGAKRLIGHGLDHSHIVPEIAGSAVAPRSRHRRFTRRGSPGDSSDVRMVCEVCDLEVAGQDRDEHVEHEISPDRR